MKKSLKLFLKLFFVMLMDINKRKSELFNLAFRLMYSSSFSNSDENFYHNFLLDKDYARKIELNKLKIYTADIKNAIIIFNIIIDGLDNRDVRSIFLRGISKYNLMDFIGALDDFELAVDLESNMPYYFYMLGKTKSSLDMHLSAIIEYSKAINFDSNYTEALWFRALSRINVKEHLGAIDDFSKLIELLPNKADLYYSRGEAKYNLKKNEESIIDYNECIKIDPKHYNINFKIANYKYDSGLYLEAIKYYDREIEYYPDHENALFNRASAKMLESDFRGAADDYSKLIIINPKFPNAHLSRGCALTLCSNDLWTMWRDFGKAIEMQPDDFNCYYYFGINSLLFDAPHQAYDLLNEAIKISPKNIDAYFFRGKSKRHMGTKRFYASAVKDFDRVIKHSPRRSEAYLERGIARYKLKDYVGAIEDCNIVFETDPFDYYVLELRGECKYKLRLFEEANTDFENSKILDKSSTKYSREERSKHFKSFFFKNTVF